MAEPPSRFLAGIRRLDSPFTTDEVEKLFPKLRPKSISVYLSLAVRSGLLEQVSKRCFRNPVRTIADGKMPRIMAEAVERLRGELMPLDLERLIIWSDDEINPFLPDLSSVPFLVIEGRKVTLQAVSRILQKDGEVMTVNRRASLASLIWSRGKRFYLVPNESLQGTRPSGYGFQEPTISRVLMWSAQMPGMPLESLAEMMERPDFNLKMAVGAAPSKRVAATIGMRVMEVLAEYPDHPVRRQVNAGFIEEGA